jgi:hypothetical protein
VELAADPELDHTQAERQLLLRDDKTGMHQNPATGVKLRPTSLAAPTSDLVQNIDRIQPSKSILFDDRSS